MNYTELQQALQDFTENSEATFVANIPRFVRAAEQRIYDAGYLPAARESQTAVLTTASPYLASPSAMIAPYAMSVILPVTGRYVPLVEKDVTYIREAYPIPDDTALPKYYGIFDENTFIFGPSPDFDYTVHLDYYAYPESIVTANTTWLGDKAETVLFYGALREAYNIFMKGEQDMVANIEKMYAESVALMQERGVFARRAETYRKPTMRRAS